jgi:hypothetical protein
MKISESKLKKIVLQEAKRVLRESTRPGSDFASLDHDDEAGSFSKYMDHAPTYGEEGDEYADSEQDVNDYYDGIEKYSEDEYEDEEDEYDDEEDEYDDEEDEESF